MSALDLVLLGGFQARLRSGEIVSLPAKKAQALLAFLGLRAGHAYARDKLAALLWGESTDERARDGLRHALVAVRRVLPVTLPPIIAVEGHTLAVNPTLVRVDVASFEAHVAEGTPAALEHAALAYGGDFLSGFNLNEPLFEEWLVSERARLRELAVEALAKLLAHQSKTEATERAIRTAVRLLGLDPLQEAVHRTLMRLYVRQGRRGAALRQYQICVGALQRELGAEPEAETRHIYLDLLGQRPDAKGTMARTRPAPGCHFVPAPLGLPSKDVPLFGRKAERSRLTQALDGAASGRGQVVILVGEAGIGKTSLLGAFANEAVATPARALLGRCYESTQILPFGPWIDAIRAGSVLADESILGRLDSAWRAELTRLFPEMDGSGLPPSSDNDQRLFESVARLFEHLSAENLVVVMLEDVHWADEMSLRLLAFVARRLPAWRLLLVATSREDELADAAVARRTVEEMSREAHVTRVCVAPLTRRDTVDLIRSLARACSAPEALGRLEEQVWTVSEGNPFVVVETTRALLEGAILPESTHLPVPERVRAMIAARLTQLSESARHLAGVAAVVGRECDFRALQRISGLDEASAAEGVEELVRRRVLHVVGERLDFTHHRLRVVVYDGLLPPRRRLLHRLAGEALEALEPGNPASDPLSLGLHFREGEVWEKAARYLRAAGVDAIARSAYGEAAACLEQALVLSEHLPETREGLELAVDLRLDLRASLHAAGELDKGFEHLRNAERLARTLNDERRLGFASMHLAHCHWLKLQLPEARHFGKIALAIGEARADSCLTIAASFYLGTTSAWSGDYREAVAFYEMSLKALRDHSGRERCGLMGFPAVMIRGRFAETLAEQGEFRQGLTQAKEALQIAEELNHPYSLAMACHSLGILYGARGELKQAACLLERGLALADTWSLPVWIPTLSPPLGQVYALMGRSAEAIAILRLSVQRFESMYRRPAPGVMVKLGTTFMHAGRLDEALSLARDALALSRRYGQRGVEAWGLRLMAEIAALKDSEDAAESEDFYKQALDLAETLGMRPLAARCHLGLGELYKKIGYPEQAKKALTAGQDLFHSMEMTFGLDQTRP